MRVVQFAYAAIYIVTVVVFAVCSLALAGFAVFELVQALSPSPEQEIRARFDRVLEAIGLTTIAVASLELSQTVLEEEVQRKAVMSAPTRVRRFLSRFLVVVVVSLGVECLISVFAFAHHDPARLPQAAAVGVAAALLLVAWGGFVRLNEAAERLEPEGIRQAKQEDHAVGDSGAEEASDAKANEAKRAEEEITDPSAPR
jgi:hypothetical protein